MSDREIRRKRDELAFNPSGTFATAVPTGMTKLEYTALELIKLIGSENCPSDVRESFKTTAGAISISRVAAISAAQLWDEIEGLKK